MLRLCCLALLSATLLVPSAGSAYTNYSYGAPLFHAIAHKMMQTHHLGTPLANRSVHQERVDAIYRRDAMPGKSLRYQRPTHQKRSGRVRQATERQYVPYCRSYNKPVRDGQHVRIELRRVCLQADGSWQAQ